MVRPQAEDGDSLQVAANILNQYLPTAEKGWLSKALKPQKLACYEMVQRISNSNGFLDNQSEIGGPCNTHEGGEECIHNVSRKS
jgi:hypothetical protein